MKVLVVLMALVATGCSNVDTVTAPLKKDRTCMRYYAKMAMKADMSNPVAVDNINKAMVGMGCEVHK